MNKFLHKTVSVTMALLLLLSTTSWKVEKHYCMGHLIDVALFSEPDSCGMNMSLGDDDLDVSENSCCDDEVVILNAQDDLKLSLEILSLEKHFFIQTDCHSFTPFLSTQNIQVVLFEQYPPPQLVKDIQVLDQVFLI